MKNDLRLMKTRKIQYIMKAEIIPVIHMINLEQVFANVETCVKNGIKKVFLINHVVSAQDVLSAAKDVKSEYPELWVGVNLLGVPTSNAICLPDKVVDGLWCDGTLTIEDITNRRFTGMLFGGLAFKYQRQPSDLEEACKNATLTTDVATTSGPGTGKAATITKIETIRGYLGSHPMAIASGVSADNIENYMHLVDYLLVASSITDKDEMIIEGKLVELMNKLK
jgi:uncharacterized protein